MKGLGAMWKPHEVFNPTNLSFTTLQLEIYLSCIDLVAVLKVPITKQKIGSKNGLEELNIFLGRGDTSCLHTELQIQTNH